MLVEIYAPIDNWKLGKIKATKNRLNVNMGTLKTHKRSYRT